MKSLVKLKLGMATLLLLTNTTLYAQSPQDITDADLIRFRKEIQQEAIKVREDFLKGNRLSDFQKQYVLGFRIDTFSIEKMYSKRVQVDYSTMGIINAAEEAEIQYDKLLNKYYQMLIKKLSDSDKEVVKQSQRNWISFRESEKKLFNLLADERYSGGGSMQQTDAANQKMQLTKKRVVEIFEYFSSISE